MPERREKLLARHPFLQARMALFKCPLHWTGSVFPLLAMRQKRGPQPELRERKISPKFSYIKFLESPSGHGRPRLRVRATKTLCFALQAARLTISSRLGLFRGRNLQYDMQPHRGKSTFCTPLWGSLVKGPRIKQTTCHLVKPSFAARWYCLRMN